MGSQEDKAHASNEIIRAMTFYNEVDAGCGIIFDHGLLYIGRVIKVMFVMLP